jgi:hypothetical protein
MTIRIFIRCIQKCCFTEDDCLRYCSLGQCFPTFQMHIVLHG